MQDNTSVATTFTHEQAREMFHRLLTAGTLTKDRDLAMAVLAYVTLGRSDDTRSFFLPDLMRPRLMPVIGEWFVHGPSNLVM
jgi:hypothetical protein